MTTSSYMRVLNRMQRDDRLHSRASPINPWDGEVVGNEQQTTVKRSRVLRSHTFDGQPQAVPTNVWSEVVEQLNLSVERMRGESAASNQRFSVPFQRRLRAEVRATQVGLAIG